jgi:transcriptional regulator with XRE-family HTH domain
MTKSLRYIVKEIQLKRGWTVEQVAESIGYSRVHLTREMQKKTENETLKQTLVKAHENVLSTLQNNVISEQQPDYSRRSFEKTIQANLNSIEESQAQLASLAVVQLNQLALIRAKLEGRPVAKVQDEINKDIAGVKPVKNGKDAGIRDKG